MYYLPPKQLATHAPGAPSWTLTPTIPMAQKGAKRPNAIHLVVPKTLVDALVMAPTTHYVNYHQYMHLVMCSTTSVYTIVVAWLS